MEITKSIFRKILLAYLLLCVTLYFCYEYFNHSGSSPDLLNWVKGTIEDIEIVKKSKINSKSLLDISSSDSNKITVYEVTPKGVELINSLNILPGVPFKCFS